MRARGLIPLFAVGVLVLGLTGASEQSPPLSEQHESARTELTEAQNRARLHEEHEFLPPALPEEIHGQIERELHHAWHAVEVFLVICIILLSLFLLPLLKRKPFSSNNDVRLIGHVRNKRSPKMQGWFLSSRK